MVSWLELPWLSRPIVVALLGLLRSTEVFPDQGHHSVDPLPPQTDMLDRLPVASWLLLPRLSCHIQEAPGLPPEQELKGGEAHGSLRDLLDAEEDVGQHLVPITSVFSCHTSQHLFEGLIKQFDQAVRLGVIDRGSELFHFEEPTDVRHQTGHEGGPLVGQNLSWDADTAAEEEQLLGDGLGGGLTQGNSLRVPGGIIDNHQDVLVSPGGLWQRPH